MSDRTFKIDSPLMKGDDIRAWQEFLLDRFERWHISYPLALDGVYGTASRAATRSLMRAWGVIDGADAMQSGLTPYWRTKIRDDRRTDVEQDAFHSNERVEYRQTLRDRFQDINVCFPCVGLITDDNGWSSWHDGVDMITAWRGPALAICDAIVRRVSSGGWWGNNPVPSPGHPISDGDGIIIIESTVDVGPFQRGMHFGYGHTEEATVEEGDEVNAGEVIGRIGWARAPHIHFMVNDDKPVNGFYRGTGDRDPMPFLDYARNSS